MRGRAFLTGLAWIAVARAAFAQGTVDVTQEPRVWTQMSLGLVSGKRLNGMVSPGADGALVLRASAIEGEVPLRLEAFDWLEVHAQAAPPRTDHARFIFELHDGARLTASIVAIEGGVWTLASDLLGEVAVPADAIAAIAVGDGAGELYRGPNGLAGFVAAGRKDGWVVDRGTLVANGARAELARELPGLAGRPISLTLGWRGEPLFRVGLGAKAGVLDDVVVEAWGDRLVAWRDAGRRIELLELPADLAAVDRVTLRARVDRDRVVFFDEQGGELGALARGANAGERLVLACDGLGLTLHELVVGAVGGAVLAAEFDLEDVLGFDLAARAFRARGAAIPERDVARITRRAPVARHDEPPAPALGGPVVARCVHVGGDEVTGLVVGAVAPAALQLRVPWSVTPITCRLPGLARVEVQQHAADRRRYKAALESFVDTGRGQLAGTFVGLDEQGRLEFLPTISATPVQLQQKGLERIVFNTKSAFFAPANRFPHLVHMRSGETFRARVTGIDAAGIALETAVGPSVVLAEARVKAIEIDLRAAAELRQRFAPTKRNEVERSGNVQVFVGGPTALPPRRHEAPFRKESLELALALPRKYKERPPSHLVVGPNGDFLRATVTGLGADGLRVATRAVTESGDAVQEVIPPDRVAVVVWLAPDPAPEGAHTGAPAGAVTAEGGVAGRLHLDGEHVLDVVLLSADRESLSLRSAVLGDFTLPHASVQRLDLDGQPLTCAYARWVLTPMPEPRMAQ